MTTNQTREQWLTGLADVICHEIIAPHTARPIPPFKVTIAALGNSREGTTRQRKDSDGALNEITIAARFGAGESFHVAEILCHKLIHAFDDCESKHRGHFRQTANRIGLHGTSKNLYAGFDLSNQLNDILADFGDLPHYKLNEPVKSKGRNNNKIVCTACGFKANLSKPWAEKIEQNITDDVFVIYCPVCDSPDTTTIIIK